MQAEVAAAVFWVIVIAAVIFGFTRLASDGGSSRSATGGGPGPGASGAIYDWLNQEKRKAVEIIVEEKAGARDPEDKDGNLPELEKPRAGRAAAPRPSAAGRED